MNVTVDEATVSDGNMLGTLLQGSANGASVTRSVRALVMQFAGEVETAILKQKSDDTGSVLQDDGAPIIATDEDGISAAVKDPSGNGAHVSIAFSSFQTPSGRIQSRACSVNVCTPSGERITVSIPPVLVERGPDDIFTKACKTAIKCKKAIN